MLGRSIGRPWQWTPHGGLQSAAISLVAAFCLAIDAVGFVSPSALAQRPHKIDECRSPDGPFCLFGAIEQSRFVGSTHRVSIVTRCRASKLFERAIET
jgi:hypothetical protein